MGSFFSKSFDPATDVPDLKGKVVIVTGGKYVVALYIARASTLLTCNSSAGVGFATIQHLARHGAKVYMAARNEQKAKAAIERLHADGLGPGNGEVIWLQLDLSNPRDVKKAAEEFLQKEQRLDILSMSSVVISAHCDPDSENLLSSDSQQRCSVCSTAYDESIT